MVRVAVFNVVASTDVFIVALVDVIGSIEVGNVFIVVVVADDISIYIVALIDTGVSMLVIAERHCSAPVFR